MTSTVSFPSHKATCKLEGQGDKSHSEQLEGSEQESHIAQPPSLVDAATHIQGAASLLRHNSPYGRKTLLTFPLVGSPKALLLPITTIQQPLSPT